MSRRVGLAVVAIALVACACGVPREAGPEQLPKSDLPAELTRTAPTTSIPAPPGTVPHDSVEVTVWWVLNDQLNSGFGHYVRSPLSLPYILQALNRGPGPTLEGYRVTTDIPITPDLRSLGIKHGTASIQLGNNFFELSPSAFALAIGQIVVTLMTSLSRVDRVQFFANGTKQDVETGTGALATGPVTDCNYTNLLPTGSHLPGCQR